MLVQSLGESITTGAGVVQLAFDLSGSEAGYVIISIPIAGAQGADEFFGADHYVEIKDQLFGTYGGLRELTVMNDRTAVLGLAEDVPGIGRELSIVTAKAMSSEFLEHLRQLQRT
jgi:hypothetical protein